MAYETQSKCPFESHTLLEDMSIPILCNTESNSHDSVKLQSQTDTTLQQNDFKFQDRTSKSASSTRQLSEYQYFRLSQENNRKSLKDQRLFSGSFNSWRGLLNIQDSGSEMHTQNEMKSGMRSMFRSLLTLVSFGNYSSENSSGKLDTFATSLPQSLSYIHEVPRESVKEVSRESPKDIRTDSFKQAANESFTDLSCSPFTEISSDLIKDITHDSFTDASSDSLEDISQNAFKYSSSNSLKGKSSEVSKDMAGDLFKSTPGYLYEDALGDVYTDVPENVYKVTPGDLYGDTCNDLYTGITRTLYTEIVRDLDKHINKDRCEDISKYSKNNTPGHSLEDTLRYSHEDTSENLFKDTFRDLLKDMSADSFKDTPTDLLEEVLQGSLKDTLTDCFKDMTADSFKDVPVDSHNDTLKDSQKNTFRDSLNGAHQDSLNDALKDSIKDAQDSSLKHKFNENCANASSNHKSPTSDHTFNDKLPTTPRTNTAVYFSHEHQCLETTSSLIHQSQTSTAKQDPSLPLPTSLSFLGVLANFLFITPCVVAHWNSTWCYFDHILQDYNCSVSVWTSAAIGFPIMAVCTFFQNSLLSYSIKCNRFVRFVLSRAYTYILGVACISQWRSIWIIADCYVGTSLFNSSVTFAVVFLVLLLSGCLATMCSPPVTKDMEVPHTDHYKIFTFWGKTASGTLYALLDTLISVFGIHVLSITYWRTFWEILDFCLIPDDPLQSAIWSIGISLSLSCILLILERPVMELSRHLHATNWLLMMIFQDLISVLYSIICITYWRGVWMILDLYMPFRPTSLYIAHGVSFGILMLFLTVNSVLVRNVDRDGGECISFDVSYVATLIQTLRRKTRKDTKYRTELLLQGTQCPGDGDHV